MAELLASCFAEYLKIRRSRMLWLTVAALCLAPVFGALFVLVLRNPDLAAGNEALRAKAALTGFSADWPSFLNLIAQAVGVGGVIVFGFVTSWVYGREFSDHTLKDIITLPVSRGAIVVAKLIACLVWCLVIIVAVTIAGLAIGLLLGLPDWPGGRVIGALGRVFLTGALAMALGPPVSFVATVGRGYLAPLGYVVLTVVVAQILGALGLGAYVPWAVPALFSGLGSEAGGGLSWISYAIVVLTGCGGLLGTLYWWDYVDQPG